MLRAPETAEGMADSTSKTERRPQKGGDIWAVLCSECIPQNSQVEITTPKEDDPSPHPPRKDTVRRHQL